MSTENTGIVVYSDASGSGLGRVCVELCSALEEIGVQVTLIASQQPIEPKTTGRILVRRAGGAARGRVGRLANKLVHIWESAVAVWKTCNSDRPLLMIHLPAPLPLSLAPAWIARFKGAKVALNLHDLYPHTLRFPRFLHPLERFLYRYAYRQFDFLFPMTSSQSSKLTNEVGIKSSKVSIIQHGIFQYDFITAPSDDILDTTILVFGSLRPNKRIRETILATQSLVDIGKNIRLKIAGSPRPEDGNYWNECLALIRPNDPVEIFSRFIDESEVPSILSGVDGLICPYEDFDSQSGVAIMGLSNGICLLATTAGATSNPERLGRAWTEIGAPVTVDGIMTSMLDFMATNRPARQNAGRAAAELMKHEFGWKAAAIPIRDSFANFNRRQEQA